MILNHLIIYCNEEAQTANLVAILNEGPTNPLCSPARNNLCSKVNNSSHDAYVAALGV